MVSEILSSIQEVQECGKNRANHYLKHGYILLDVQQSSRASEFPKDEAGEVRQYQYYVRKNPIYVIGRPNGVAQAPQWNKDEG